MFLIKWESEPQTALTVVVFPPFSVLLKIVIQVSPSTEASGWLVDYEDMESGDNGFPGDTDESDITFFSRPVIVVVCID